MSEVHPSAEMIEDTPGAIYDGVHPDQSASYLEDIITIVSNTDRIEGVAGGASSSLQPVQKTNAPHPRSVAAIRR